MISALTIIKYRKWLVPFAFFAMAIHRLPLWLNKNITFYKLMGSGKNGTFDKVPDLHQWAILTVYKEMPAFDNAVSLSLACPDQAGSKTFPERLYGKFIAAWFRFFKCELHTYILDPVDGHGKWDGKNAFGEIERREIAGKIAVLTRATIKLNKLKYFWAHVAPVAAKMTTSKGFVASYGIGEVPWIKQATFSIWESKEDMIAFAYGMQEHREVVKKTRAQKWYSEDMFVRFKIVNETSSGTTII
jgi:hypothetical protein